MLLPIRRSHDCGNRCACGRPEHRNNTAVLGKGNCNANLDEAGTNRLRDAGLAVLRAFERVAALGLDLGLVTGFSEVHAAPSAAPPQPHPGKSPGRVGPRSPSQPLHVTTATLRSRPKASHF